MASGSPCQKFSVLHVRRKGLEGARSGFFYEYVEVYRRVSQSLVMQKRWHPCRRNGSASCQDVLIETRK